VLCVVGAVAAQPLSSMPATTVIRTSRRFINNFQYELVY
jgi:hypothetical protein